MSQTDEKWSFEFDDGREVHVGLVSTFHHGTPLSNGSYPSKLEALQAALKALRTDRDLLSTAIEKVNRRIKEVRRKANRSERDE